jgi:hypothetical protein
MQTLFPAWSDTAFRVALVALMCAGVAALVGPLIYVRGPAHQRREFPLDQPVQFDHRHHVGDDEIDCLYCHPGARTGAFAGIPATEVCMGCHNQVWPDNIQLEPVRRSYFSGEPLRWNRVHQLPQYVYFNHSIHIHQGVGCVTCHGRVDRMGLVYQVAPLTMGFCLDCHRDPLSNLRPNDQITSMTWQLPDDQRARDALLSRLDAEYHPRRLTSCTNCHR